MNHGTERNRKAWEKLTPEQQAAYLAGRERCKAERETPEYQAELAADIAAIQREYPPARPDAELVEALAALRLERERQGLSLTDVSKRSGIDRATISKLETGKIANPTVGTLRAYAKALGRRLAWTLAE